MAPAGPAAGVEDARPRSRHGVDQAGLAGQIGALGGELAEAVDVPLRVAVLGAGEPAGNVCHVPIVQQAYARRVNDSKGGVIFGVLAYLCWGFFPLYWPLLDPASALEVLAHRFVWSMVFVLIALVAVGKWRTFVAIARDRRSWPTPFVGAGVGLIGVLVMIVTVAIVGG